MNTGQTLTFKQQALEWASSFEVCCFLDSNQYKDVYGQYECLIAAGTTSELIASSGTAFDELRKYVDLKKDWMFGLLSYELKNEVEELSSNNPDFLGFPDLYFFVPKYVIALRGEDIVVIKGEKDVVNKIQDFETSTANGDVSLKIEPRISRTAYIDIVNEIKAHIKRGDIYEVNFCHEFFASNAQINPVKVYQALNELSPTPFSGFLKIYDHYILSATPERFLCKRGQKLISQPIKGTAKRNRSSSPEAEKAALANSPKERAENVMIVDLVRNDLTKSAIPGTVGVEELFGIYSFPQVHQMISTISCMLDPNTHIIDAIKNSFPMGSMTGAPKIKAMELIEHFEKSRRGAYSGSFGCISPEGDFDFNVVIRSILYNKANRYLSFQVGGAITYAANAEDEYEECLLKASAMLGVLNSLKAN